MLTGGHSEKKEAESNSSDITPKNGRVSVLQRLGAVVVTLIAMWYLFGIPGYILFEKFLGSSPSDATELDIPPTAPE